MVGFQYVGSPTAGLWQPHLGDPPPYLLDALQAPPEECLIAGYNMVFDGMAMDKLGLPVPLEKQLDIALLSYMLGFAGSLDQVLEQFEIPMRKSPEGRRLITTFSRMQKPWYQHPSDWEKFVRYCEQDVTVEVELLKKCARWLDTTALAPVVRQVQAQWLMDQRMNARGLPVDTATVDGALSILREETRRLTAWLKDATGLANPNSVQQLGAWLAAEGQPLPDLRAGTIIEALDQMDPGSTVYQVLEARQSLGRASVKKYAAMAASHVGSRLKGSVTTYGASRTGRTASRGINLANLERPKLRFTDEAAEVMASGSHEAFKAFLEVFEGGTPVIQGLGSCVRGAIKAPEGRGITAVDLKSIESVGLAWVVGCDVILDLFHSGRDTYKDFATRYYKIDYDTVTKKQRTFCKPVVLGAGYGAAGGALVSYAKGMGIVMEEDVAREMIRVFRTEFHEIPAYWKKVEATVKEAIRNPKVMQYVYPEGREWPRVAYYYDGTFLFCGLPSGRTLFYFRPMISIERRRSNRTGDPDWFSESISYMGKKQDAGGAWQRVFTHGGKLTENLIQAVCRDILYHGLALIDQDPEIELVGSLYDEVITLTPLGTDEPYKRICRYMETKPSWLDDRFFLGSDGYCNAGRYRK